jgi:predicted Zn finger-like uncharacterized protein
MILLVDRRVNTRDAWSELTNRACFPSKRKSNSLRTMFTQCPACRTMFRVTAADLAAAEGRVQCSKCEGVFDGHAHLLSDQEAARAPDPRIADDGPPIGDLFGTSHLIESTDVGSGVLDDAALDDQAIADSALAAAVHAAEEGPAIVDRTLPNVNDGFPTLRDAGRPREKIGRWIAVCVVLGLALVGQVVHANRDVFARDPAVGTLVVDAYQAMRLPITAPSDLGALTIARTEVTSHPLYDGVLYITATVSNDAAFPQPLPLLRVRLDDRWGEALGVRMFMPSEYLRTPPAPGARAEPGRSYAIALEVLDPGNDAVGYALAPCLSVGNAIVCSGDDPGAR